jgi:hypothetical protein
LKRVAGGDAATYLEALKTTLEELALCAADTEEDVKDLQSKLFVSLKNIMSDQCATNGVFNQLLIDLRTELLPAVIDDFEQYVNCLIQVHLWLIYFYRLPDSTKQEIISVGTYSCRMHLIINCSDAADKGLAAFEEAICEGGSNPHSFLNSKEKSGTFRLARTCASAFTARGSQTAGVHHMWEVFLRLRGGKNLFLTFHGHRMNIGMCDLILIRPYLDLPYCFSSFLELCCCVCTCC